MRRTFYVSSDNVQVCVLCTEEELDAIAIAIGRGNGAKTLVAYDQPNCTAHSQPYKVYWDCI